MSSSQTQSNSSVSSSSRHRPSRIKKKIVVTKQFDYTFKIVMIGDSGVGKSCILLRYADDKFNENFYSTIGVDFRFKNILLDNKSVKLQIWDTAGQERFKTITSAYYRGAHGILIVYDVTDKNSFNHVKDWIEDINKYTDDNPVKLIIGNKCDLSKEKVITDAEMKAMEQQTGLEIIETSAKNSIKINEAMEIIAGKMIEKSKNNGEINSETTAEQGYNLGEGNIKGCNKQELCCDFL